MRTLRPIVDKSFYHVPAAEMLEYRWYEELFAPIYDILQEKLGVKHNSKAALKRALETGKVQWYDGFFTGPFSAAISKDIRSMGGVWNKTKKAFGLGLISMPNDIKAAISAGHARVTDTIKRIYDALDKMHQKERIKQDFTPSFEKVVGGLNKQFVETVSAAKNISVQPYVSPEMKRKLAERYSENLNHFADEFTENEVWKIRQTVAKNVLEGFRSDRLMKQLQSEYGITKRKAKFLARQETSLMISKYRQARYEEVGLKKYKWSTSHDERVRPDHRELNGRVFAYAQPPITDKATGARNNPGEDFNCRCVAVPILEN